MLNYLLLFILIASSGFAQSSIVILGDSLTEGYGVEMDEAYPKLIEAALIKEKISAKVVNSGISGSTSASCSSRIQWALKSKPNLIVIALGANDALRGLDPLETKKNIKACISLVKKENIKVALLGMQAPPNYGPHFTKKYNSIFDEIKFEEKVSYFPFFIAEIAGKKEFNLSDGIHPNKKGHQVIADKLLPFIKGLL